MDLIKLTDSISYIDNFTNIGIIHIGDDVVLVDSGLDKGSGKKILNILNENDMFPVAIINTHAHADHFGGNNYIHKNTGLDIIAPVKEAAIMENPEFEPYSFFSGAAPVRELRNKFLMASSIKVTRKIYANTQLDINGASIRFVGLPGHSINQIGVEFDNNLFCGDAIFSTRVLNKYKIPFLIDAKKYKKTLDFLKNTNYNFYILAHGQPVKDILDLVEENKRVITNIEKLIINILDVKKTTEELLKSLFNKLNVKISGPQQYYLLKTSIMAYLSDLQEQGIIHTRIKNNIICWQHNDF